MLTLAPQIQILNQIATTFQFQIELPILGVLMQLRIILSHVLT
jgi:hypothetical protein